MRRVDQDVTRFRRIVKGEIRKNLRRFVAKGDLLTRQGGRTVTVPLPQINLPRFTYGSRGGKGVGQGEPGDGEGEAGQGGQGEAGEQPGEHDLEVEVGLDDLAQILGEELQLPRIEPRGARQVEADVHRYRSIRRTGPQGLRHFRRTYLEALKREIASGTYDPENPLVVPRRDDERFRSYQRVPVPESSAAIIYMMDVSGSMGQEQKEIVRNTAFWLDTWIRSQYRNVAVRYIVHDAAAREVDRHAFFHLKESGGTKISSAYHLCNEMIDTDYPPDQWNVYGFQFSDGDNWSGGDTAECLRLLTEQLIPKTNLFCYGQVKSAYGSGQYKGDLDKTFADEEALITTDIADRDAILDCIRDFLGVGTVTMNFHGLPRELREMEVRARDAARELGLDFPEVVFELIDPAELNMIAAYGGFPVRYPHWRFGMEFQNLHKSYEYGLSRIYELVINTDPCYAYLMKTNTLMEQKLVMAHVYGHADFFRNNAWFEPTDRKMVDTMANHGTRVRRHVDAQGAEAVERFLDACLSLENLLDPMSLYIERPTDADIEAEEEIHAERYAESRVHRFPVKQSYMDPYVNPKGVLDAERKRLTAERLAPRKHPRRPTADVLQFLLENAPLEEWQADCLDIIREEAYYFAPQRMTKVLNEGWAVWVHSRLMSTKLVDPSEIVSYCDKHAGTLATQPGQINPYRLGYTLLCDIEDRWDRGAHGPEWRNCDNYAKKRAWDTGAGEGVEHLFHVRRVHNDVSFLDRYLTPEYIEENELYIYGRDPQTGQIEVLDRDPVTVKPKLIEQFSNAGQPLIEVEDANYENRGELLLVHRFSGTTLRPDFADATMRALHLIWGRPVHVMTADENGEPLMWTFDGEKHTEQKLDGKAA